MYLKKKINYHNFNFTYCIYEFFSLCLQLRKE